MSERGIIEGQVTDAAGNPRAGANVAIVEGDQPFPEIAAVSNAEGIFRLTGLLPGAYSVEARLQELCGKAQVTVTANAKVFAEIKLR